MALPIVDSRKSKRSCAVAVNGMFEIFKVVLSTVGLSIAIVGELSWVSEFSE